VPNSLGSSIIPEGYSTTIQSYDNGTTPVPYQSDSTTPGNPYSTPTSTSMGAYKDYGYSANTEQPTSAIRPSYSTPNEM